MKKKLMICLVVLSMFCLGFTTKFQKLVPARQDVGDVKKVAVLDFEGEGGKIVAEILASALLKPGFYEIMASQEDADAVITGLVSGYKVETERGSLVKTPATYDAEGHITTFATYRYWISKSAKVGINYKMIRDGKLIASKYVAKSYNSGKHYEDDPAYFQIASDEAILNDLVSNITDRVVPEFSPHYVRVKRKIYKGKSEYMKKGYKLAKAGKWADAVFEWRKELIDSPQNTDAIHNLNVAYEREGAIKPKEKAKYKPLYKGDEGLIFDPLNIEE